MKKIFLGAGLALATLLSFTILPKPRVFVVDNSTSSVKWTAYKVTGKHFGQTKFSNGELLMDGSNLVGGKFTMDMNTMTVEDISGGGAEKLLGHLKSDDFFSVSTHGTSTLVIKQATAKGGNNFDVKADLTIKGITQEVSFTANVAQNGNNVTASAFFKVDRTKFGIKYRSGNFFENLGDKAINDEFDIMVNVTAKAAPAAATGRTKKSGKG